MKRTFLAMLLFMSNMGVSIAQVANDSLAEDFRSIAAKNFSRYRTINFSWEMDADHDYTIGLDNKELQKSARRRYIPCDSQP